MIKKEIDPKNVTNHLEKSGFEAEKQMAFYLQRAFNTRNDVMVLNDIRLLVDGQTVQIDHLILHTFGFFIIESKSVNGEIIINDHDEWIRKNSTNVKGMPSAVLQAQRQIDLFKEFLQLKEERLAFKNGFGSKVSLLKFKFEPLVAISDKGIIKRPQKLHETVLFKADQIPTQITMRISEYEKAAKAIFSLDISYQLREKNLLKLSRLILSYHTPKESKSPLSTNEKVLDTPRPITPITKEEYRCKACNSHDIEVRYAKNYYFKCLACDANTPIRASHINGSCVVKIRRENKIFHYFDCQSCNVSMLFFTNRPSP